MTRIALVEDDPVCRRQLEEYLERYAREAGEKFKLYPFGDGDDIVSGYKAEYDIIFMDIQMRFMDGMTAAEEIRRVDDQVVIIFITSLASYAVKGYAVDALDYVLKPVSYYAFSQSVGRALARLHRRRRRYVFISSKNGAQRVDCARIDYIEVDGHSLVYHTREGELVGSGTMRELEESLAGGPFFRCGKGVLINLEQVDGVADGDAVIRGVTVQVSRSRKKAFLDALNRCINEVGP